MYINKTDNTSFNFKAPLGKPESSVNEVLFPVPDVQVEPDLSADVEVKQMVTIVDAGELSANATLNLNIDAQLTVGAVMHVKVKSDGTVRNLTLGTGLTGPAISGTANKTKVQSFIYDGTSFLPMGGVLQID